MVTIKELAKILGVSRGTVDRALHNRGNVSPELRDRILEKAKELNYQPNKAGLMLALRKQPRKIGALVSSVGNPFFVPIISGMMKANEENKDLGFSLIIEEVKGFDKTAHLNAIKKLVEEKKCDALVLATMDETNILSYLSTLSIPIIAVNSDISLPEKLCYVGPDYYTKGALHAGLLTLAGSKGKRILILRGSSFMKGHDDLVKGFIETLAKKDPSASIAGEYDTADENEYSEMIVREKLSEDPSIDTLFIATTGGGTGAVKGTEGRNMLIFTSDDIPDTKALIKSGKIKWTICQEPFRQGYESVKRMQEWFINGERPKDLYTQHIVKLLENINTEYV